MPYTPPTQRSPATSHPSSPTLSRNHSYSSDKPGQSPSLAHRPVLPRSVSSASYLSKHRRSPSITQNNGSLASPDNTKASSDSLSNTASSSNGSVRQSPPPVSTQLIPPGAITTPPDSAEGSDTEERGRQLEELQRNLHENIEVKRGHSPVRGEDEGKNVDGAPPAPESTPTMGPALTPEARKISHSRSSSDLAPLKPPQESPEHTSDDSDVDDDENGSKPPLLRKKSGELVKPALRPSSRRRPSSMPGTPTYNKAVHFNEDIEQVRHFLQVDRPIAVSAGSSPVETYDSDSEYPFGYEEGYTPKIVEWEIRLANFPPETHERKCMPVRLERIYLSADNKTLVGNVAVANLAFQKLVVARFTLDYWKTTSEVVAEYNNDVRKKEINDGYDRFNFSIKLSDLAHLESKTMLLCIRYNVNGQEYWDNNSFTNFQVDFIKKTRPRKGVKQGPVAGTLGAIPRSRHSPPRQRTAPASFDDDFGDGFDSKYQFGSARPFLGDSPNTSIKLKNNRNKRGSIFPGSAPNGTTGPNQAFSSRYDFGASLSAALTQAQSTLGERSGLKLKSAPKPKHGYFDSVPNSMSQPAAPASVDNTPPPSAIASEKPDLKSDQYKELIQKYCFFGSGKSSPQVPSPKPSQTDGATDNDSDLSPGSDDVSGSSSPNFVKKASTVDGAQDSRSSSRSVSPFLSRSNSPGPLTGSDIGFRATSPASFGYPYTHQNTHNSILPESQTPTAISG